MSDPSLPLQAAQVAALKASGALPEVVGDRVYDEPPSQRTFPYVTVGDAQVLGEDTEDCGDGSEVFTQIDVWSQAVGYPEAKLIAANIRAALKTPPVLDGFIVSVAEFQQTRYLRDPDGKTRHAAITFRYLITHTT